MINTIARTLKFSTIITLLFTGFITAEEVAAGVIDDLQPGHWYEVPDSRLETVFPSPTPPGDPRAVMSAWNGGAYDSRKDRLIVWGGGHADYSGNEVYVFDIKTLKWSRLTNPSLDVGGSVSSGMYPDGKPRAPHTYNSVEYIPDSDKFVSVALPGQYPTGASTNVGWAFSFSTLTWERIALRPARGSQTPAIAAYDPATGYLWYRSGGRGVLSRYDSIADRWTEFASDSTDLKHYSTPALAPRRRILATVGCGYCSDIGNKQLLVWDLNNPNTRPIRPRSSGDSRLESIRAPGFQYDPVSDKFVGWNGGADVYILDPDTWVWTRISPASTNTVIPTAAVQNGTYGRFRYIPSKNVFIVVNRTNENVYIYKLTSKPEK